MPSQYVTVYEISQRSPDWLFACAGFLPLLAGTVVIWGKVRFKWAKPHWVFAAFCCVFGLLWIIAVGGAVLGKESDAFTAYKSGNYQTVEGLVTNFHPMPYEGHQDECFSVEDQRFCYSDYEIAPGFHNAASHGGPIHAGLPVRIAYLNGRILRLEVPPDQVVAPAKSAAMTTEGERAWQKRAGDDPVEQEFTTAFLFTAVCWTLWWNLQWKRAMRFWLRPPYRLWVKYLFRTFFAISFLAAVRSLLLHVRSHPLTKANLKFTISIAAITCAVVAIMTFMALWIAEQRDEKASTKVAAT